MNRYLRFPALLGACLLAMGCEEPATQAPSSFIPEVQYVPADSVSLHTRISGVAWDPEAYFIYLTECGPTCPMPPFLSEGIPLYQRAAIRDAAISAFDPLTQTTTGAAVTTDGVGIWTLPQVPSRSTAPYFVVSAAQGTIPTEQIGPPLAVVPPTQYVRTLTLRPLSTVGGSCLSQEAIHIGSTGVLEAVAKYLTANGKPTLVEDLLDPTRYHSVTVLGLFHGGNGANRAPADLTSVEVSVGQVYHIDWATPGTSPAERRSARGFIVTESPTTPVGFAVVLVPATLPRPAQITYKVKDTKQDAVARRPWVYPPISAPPQPGLVTFIGAQMGYQPPSIPLFQLPPPPSACVPM
jgi:hypothetical protein